MGIIAVMMYEIFALLECYTVYIATYRRFGKNYRSHQESVFLY